MPTEALPAENRSPPTPLWLWPNLLSLDAPLVAVVWLWFFGAAERLYFGAEFYFVVAGVVWCVYVGDRLVDVWRTAGHARGSLPQTARLSFYRRHWRIFLSGLAVVAVVVVATILWRIPENVMWYGLRASVLVLVYFWQNVARANRWVGGVLAGVLALILTAIVWDVMEALVAQLGMPDVMVPVFRYGYLIACSLAVLLTIRGHNGQALTLFPKEILCGMTFAIGVAIPVFAYSTEPVFSFFGSACVLLFGALCSLNCLAISLNERSADKVDDTAALPQRYPGLAGAFPALAVVLGGAAFIHGRMGLGSEAIILNAVSVSALLLVVLWTYRLRISSNAYRVLADVALLTPLAYLTTLGL